MWTLLCFLLLFPLPGLCRFGYTSCTLLSAHFILTSSAANAPYCRARKSDPVLTSRDAASLKLWSQTPIWLPRSRSYLKPVLSLFTVLRSGSEEGSRIKTIAEEHSLA